MRRSCAGNRGDPELLFGGPDSELAIRRELHVFAAFLRTAHFAYSARRIAVDFLGEDHLLPRRQVAGRSRDSSGFIRLGATHEDDGASVGRDAQAGDGSSIVAGEMCQLAGREIGTVGDPNIARSLSVEDPGDARGTRSSNQLRRKGRAQNFFERKVRGMSSKADAREKYEQRKTIQLNQGHRAKA